MREREREREREKEKKRGGKREKEREREREKEKEREREKDRERERERAIWAQGSRNPCKLFGRRGLATPASSMGAGVPGPLHTQQGRRAPATPGR